MRFFLDGPCVVDLVGSEGELGGLSSFFSEELQPALGVGDMSVPMVRVRVRGDIEHSPRTVYGVSGGRSWSGDFVVPDGAGHWCGFNPRALQVSDDLVVDVNLCCERFKPSVLLDWILLPIAQFSHAAMGISPLHASAASMPGETAPLVFSAWSGVGKTNMVLHAMAKGGRYFGDDRVHVDVTGLAAPSTRRVSIYGYNRRLAPGLSAAKRRRLVVGDTLHKAARRLNGRAGFLLSYAANGVGSTRAGAEELGGQAGGMSAPVLAHVLCVSSGGLTEVDGPVVERVTTSDSVGLARGHAAVMEYEFIWFQRFIQTWRWAENAFDDPWESLVDAWESNLCKYFENIPRLYRLTLPQGSPTAVAPRAWAMLSSLASD